jgi:hypothetical protein
MQVHLRRHLLAQRAGAVRFPTSIILFGIRALAAFFGKIKQ